MAYNYDELFTQIDKKLSAQPSLRLYELARQLKCSHPTVERAVAKHTALSFREYQKTKLLEMAVSLLRQGYRPREIGPAIGYKWPENFMRFVKRSTGYSLGALNEKMNFNPAARNAAGNPEYADTNLDC